MKPAEIEMAKAILGIVHDDETGGDGPATRNFHRFGIQDDAAPLLLGMNHQGWVHIEAAHCRLSPHGLDQFRLQYGEFEFRLEAEDASF